MSKIKNIFFNDFYERPIMPKWAWKISILGNPIENWTEEQLSIFSQAVTKIDIPELSMLTVTSQFKGLTFDIPSRLENNGELSLTFNENEGLDLYKALKEILYYTTYNDGYVIDEWSSQDDEGKYTDTYMLYYAPFDIWVRLYDPTEVDAEPTYNFIFRNCFVSNVGDVEMTYDSDEAYVYDVKIHYNFRIEGEDADEYIKHVEAAKSTTEDTIPEPPEVPEPEEDVTEDVATEAPTAEPKTDGVEPKQEEEETPQQRAARQAAEAMSGYRPNPTGGVETGTHKKDNRKRQQHKIRIGNIVRHPHRLKALVKKKKAKEVTDRWRDSRTPEDEITLAYKIKWREETNQDDMNNNNEAEMELPSKSDITTDGWRESSNEDDLRAMGKEKGEIPPENQAAIDELNNLDLDDDKSYMKKAGADRTKDEWQSYNDTMSKVGENMSKQSKKDEEDKIVRMERGNFKSKAERTKIEK